jgi:hypothetical protein
MSDVDGDPAQRAVGEFDVMHRSDYNTVDYVGMLAYQGRIPVHREYEDDRILKRGEMYEDRTSTAWRATWRARNQR